MDVLSQLSIHIDTLNQISSGFVHAMKDAMIFATSSIFTTIQEINDRNRNKLQANTIHEKYLKNQPASQILRASEVGGNQDTYFSS